jgi:hypothetical protein
MVCGTETTRCSTTQLLTTVRPINQPPPARSHSNSQVCLQALDCLLALIPQLRLYELTPHAKELCATLGEALGDSRCVAVWVCAQGGGKRGCV